MNLPRPDGNQHFKAFSVGVVQCLISQCLINQCLISHLVLSSWEVIDTYSSDCRAVAQWEALL